MKIIQNRHDYRALGWEKFQNPSDNHLFIIPETTLDQLASSIKERLGIRTLRVVGNPALRVTRLALNPGYPGFPGERHMLQRDDVEVLVMGEGLECETISEYGADASAEARATRHAHHFIGQHTFRSIQAGDGRLRALAAGRSSSEVLGRVRRALQEPFWPGEIRPPWFCAAHRRITVERDVRAVKLDSTSASWRAPLLVLYHLHRLRP